MTLKSFIDKNNGKFVDYDLKWGNQCTDLIRSYLKEVLSLDGFEIPPVAYAKEMFYKRSPKFTYTPNSANNFPKPGDIIVFKPYPFLFGWAGHVAIVWDANVKEMHVFEQNFPTKSPCRISWKNYRGVIGWITKKG
jgi:hypothetical protein